MEKKQCRNREDDAEDENIPLPGFRFHPTDEELVGFYLKRKVEKKLLKVDIIKQIDIYKYDPCDLSKLMTVGAEDKEWYFFCLRGRKYPNSARPNRVTGSGFWKATGIDKKIFFTSQTNNYNIGLKKSLVYYRGSAGKGTKTDWMMHEFRLPPKETKHSEHTNNLISEGTDHEAENWTICRIFRRNSATHSPKKSPGVELKVSSPIYHTSPNSSIDSTDVGDDDYMKLFATATTTFQPKQELAVNEKSFQQEQNPNNTSQWSSAVFGDVDVSLEKPAAAGSSFGIPTEYDEFDNINWDEIGRYLENSREPAVIYV